ncbi:phosphatidylserine lipase ABHD16A [Wyeomyia smithii]|uniref:phosphatidylserine lipase ABHD16A n=1 Tax=Wyeomyia smithii TaxID=174621 RepID=UPI002467D4BA|nr:phosphatidylserine lipase ABHD16A [Wyeomyia smithii]
MFYRYLLTPKLFKEYDGTKEMYEPGALEKYGDQLLTALNLMWSFGYYTSPLLITFLYRRGYFVADSVGTLAKFTTGIGLLVAVSLCMRGLGRSMNVVYLRFAECLESAKRNEKNLEAKNHIRKYDFDFKHWPVDFTVKNSVQRVQLPRNKPLWISSLPCQIVAYLAIHTFGIRMIYPGSIRMLQNYIEPMLLQGRTKLITENGGKRNKVKTADGNEIDTLFIDNRNTMDPTNNSNGRILVICSEGNAGFYEIGIMSTPIELKYSVLGWNHPGFAGSSGRPYPDQDQNAVDAVLQFALTDLGFTPENIILYGWSIGGYSTLYAASQYPDVKGVILDATFDDVLQLALPRMPESVSNIVKIAIRDYVNLNNTELISQYNGPVMLIRRTEDEMICSQEGELGTNRGNFLLISMLKYRFPNIFKTDQENLAKEMLSKPIKPSSKEFDALCLSWLMAYLTDNGNNGTSRSYPIEIGEEYSSDQRNTMATYLIIKHLQDYKSTHCTPLPGGHFQSPWEIPNETDYVFT